MKMFVTTIFFLLCLLVFETTGLCEDATRLARLQMRSLQSLYYFGTPTPPELNASDLKRVQNILASTQPDSLLLKKLYAGSELLIGLATRDLDADGVLDYRISKKDGKFFEGDLDVDNDGIWNAFDMQPYNPNVGGVDTNLDGVPDAFFADFDHDGIPDHVDFSSSEFLQSHFVEQAFERTKAQIQSELFHKHKMLVVERSARFNVKSLLALKDSLEHVFPQVFKPHTTLPTLRFVTADDRPYLRSVDDDDTDAFYHAPARTLTIYKPAISLEPLVLLGLYTHEVSHGIQYAMDFDETQPLLENSKTYYKAERFFRSLEKYGWEIVEDQQPRSDTSALFTPIFDVDFTQTTFQSRDATEWMTFIESLKLSGPEEYASHRELSKFHVVGIYSLSSPWEWLSDNYIAYVYLSMLEAVKEGESAKHCPELLRSMQSVVSQAWPDFYFYSIKGSSILADLRQLNPISKKSLDHLTKRYLIHKFCLP